MQIDIRAPTIPRRRRVWRLFPGESYQFLDDFINQGVAFLDLPGFIMPEARLSRSNDFVARVAYSDAIRDHIRQSGPGNVPELDLRKFGDARSSAKRTRLQNALVNLLEEAERGDLIVLPEPKWMSRIRVGVFENNKVISAYSEKVYGKIKVPARAVDWVGVYQERAISENLSNSLRQSYPFSLLENSLYLETFALAYDTYIYNGRHAATIFNDSEFLDADASLLSNIGKIAASVCVALDEGELQQDYTSSALLSVLLRNPPIEYTSNQESDIHSPGFTRYTSGTIVPLVLSSLLATFLALSGCTTREEMQTQLQDIEYVNSSDSADPVCNSRVSRASKLALDMLGIDKTWEICKAAREAQRRRLRPSARPRGGALVV